MSWFFPTVVILEVKNSYFLKSYLKAALNVTALGDLVRTGLTAVAPRSFLALFLFCFASLQKKFVLMCLHLEINFLKKRWSWWEFTHRLPYVEVEFDIWLFIILRFLYYFIIFFSVFFPLFFLYYFSTGEYIFLWETGSKNSLTWWYFPIFIEI